MMQAPGDNSITVVDPHVETYADTNLNEKNLGTQYIYTTEGQLIPASGDDNTTNMDLNSQHYNTLNVTEAQGIHIQQVDFEYQQQYSDGTVQQVVPVSGTEFVQDQSNTYMLEQETYVTEASQEVSTTEQVFEESNEVAAEQQAAVYEYSETTEVGETTYVTESVEPEAQITNESATDDNIEQTTTEVTGNVDQVAEHVEAISENDTSTSTNIESEGPSVETEVTETGDRLTENVPGKVSETQDKIEDVEMKEEQTVSEEHQTDVAEDQTNIENLKINPAVEIQNDESIEFIEESMQDSEMNDSEEVKTVRENVEESAEDTKKEGNLQESIPSEEDPTYIAEIAAETEVDSNEVAETPTPRPRGRKSKTDIPLHILGHNVTKPMESFVNGKSPKPRLGVRVPYRNLTSQIVSKAEIENEIVERGRKKHEEKLELSFARKLTSRLAKKIAPDSSLESSDSNKKSSKSSKKKSDVEISEDNQMDIDNNDNEENPRDKPKDAIDNNSDLLAILEGDGDAEELPDLPAVELKTKESTPTDETNLKNLEREIALQQLQDLPYMSPKTRFVKGHKFKELPSEIKEEKIKTDTISKSQPQRSPIKSNLSKLEVEPQVKVNMTLKTYSRKRKSTDGVMESSPSPSKKTNVVVSTEEIDIKPNMQPPGPAYITKSSRVIKKKVIWDPDETPARSKPSPVKAETNAQSKVVQKSAQPKNDNKSADLVKKSADLVKKSADLVKKSVADLPKMKSDKKVEEKSTPKKSVNAEKKISPGAAKAALKPKKPRTELDRLLGDEGAIKMLYDLNNSENAIEEKRNKTVFSVEKTFKELAKKANQIKSDLVNTSGAETPKFLRKKEPILSPASPIKPPTPVNLPPPVVPGAISRQKSKDSARSTPPPSPAFSYPNEVSYLIRRRSSSSISSGDDTGGSLDFDDTEERVVKKHPINTSKDPLKIKKTKKNSETDKSQKRAENRIGHYKTFSFKKTNKSVTIDMHTGNSTGCFFTGELLNELTTALNKISKEKDCNVVLIRSRNESVFCHGLNYKELVSDKESARKNKANELADRVRDFIQCLIDFPKILVAGIQGECVGLAVTMLPLFDIVIASDDARFSTSYTTLGCVAEAGFLLTVPHVSSYGLAGELLYASQKLTADEACRRGLISKLCWPEKYQDTIKTIVAAVAQGSKQSLQATKKQLRSSIQESSEDAIELMVPELVDHWISSECQSNFAQIE